MSRPDNRASRRTAVGKAEIRVSHEDNSPFLTVRTGNQPGIVLRSTSEGMAMTKTIRSQFVHEVGEMVEGCVILEKRTVIAPVPLERRRGVYDYLVEVPPIPMK